jgi:hypothetical protein
MWSHDVVSTSIGLAGDLKMGQYLKIPPRTMFLTQVWGTILGEFCSFVNGNFIIFLSPKSGAAVNYSECIISRLN